MWIVRQANLCYQIFKINYIHEVFLMLFSKSQGKDRVTLEGGKEAGRELQSSLCIGIQE